MQLLELSIQNFRGFGPTVESIRLDGDLLLFFGPNGFGKTSLAEAIEWLFYGTTKRRQRGDAYSKAEYAGSFANVHGGQPVQVEALARLHGREIRLLRRLTADEKSETFIDGSAESFGSLGIFPIEAVYPVVAQHGLQTFIHTKPKERRDAICAALGLDELTNFKTALDSARTSFQRTPPNAVTQARRELSQHAGLLLQLPATSAMARNWGLNPPRIDIDSDIAALLQASRALSAQDCPTTETALAALRERRLAASKAVFDLLTVAPAENSTEAMERLKSDGNAASTALAAVETAIAPVVAALAAAYSAAFLQFWTKGLSLAPSGATCPMCDEQTLTAERREELRRRIAAGVSATASTAGLNTAIAGAKIAVTAVSNRAVELGMPGLDQANRAALVRLLTDAPEPVSSFLDEHDQLALARKKLNEGLDTILRFLDNCSARLSDAGNAPSVVADVQQARATLPPLLGGIEGAIHSYSTAWVTFEPLLSARIAGNQLVAQIDAVGKSLRAEAQIRILGRYDAVLSEFQELIRSIERKIQEKQTELLSTRGVEVKTLYDLLNPSADVGFYGMEPGTDNMKLHAKSFGVNMPAAANLSECQLNCIGLAVWLMRATTASSPFGFVLLDDPVQSMDDDHAEAFIAKVVPNMLDVHGKQVIVLSHVKSITDRLRALNQNRPYRLYHFDNYLRTGPVITEQIGLRMLLAEIKGAARGNESNRKFSVDRIRVLVEHFIRELHMKIVGLPAPPQYDNATAKDLLPLFQTIQGTTQVEHTGLRDTVRFSDPAHHTQVGYSVPLTSNIQPHIDRLEGLLHKYHM